MRDDMLKRTTGLSGTKKRFMYQPDGFMTILYLFLALIVIILVLYSVGKVGILFPETKAEEVKTEEVQTIELSDFPSTEEGTFGGQLNPAYFKEQLDQVVILFASAKIPGLTILYYPYEHRLVAGTPQMVISDIVFFDGQAHEIMYSFKKGGNQYFFYDGKVVGQSAYVPSEENMLTGLVTGPAVVVVSEGFEMVEVR